ncbi:LacI family DNA-binding transcriptional regulator [Beduinella massiliensis]|uniref:LacI family DNA-binding transcriptional regulator n=1 Tax=Beduinella massiliensis TaxID=1852363 RepID=UPI0031F85DBD
MKQKLIAEKAGVSFATVSRALTHSAKVRPETMQRIRKAMQELGISDSDALFQGRGILSKTVLVVVGDIATEFFAHIILGLYDVLEANGYQMSLCNSRYDSEVEMRCIKTAEENGYAGIIMITAVETQELVSFLQSAEIPVVLVNRYIRSLDLDVVRIDNYRGGYLAAQHLIENGHRRIAHLAGPRNSAAPQDRLRGFTEAMHDNGVPFTQDDAVFGDLSRECGKKFADWLMPRDYTAAYIGNNYMAAGAVHQLLKLGRRVPEDISIVCFDDSPLVSEDGLNLTTISCEPQIMGRAAAETLLKRIADPLGRHVKTIYSPRLNARGSVRSLRE